MLLDHPIFSDAQILQLFDQKLSIFFVLFGSSQSLYPEKNFHEIWSNF